MRKLIDDFRDTQDRAIDYLHRQLDIPLPKTGLDWAIQGHNAVRVVSDAFDRDGVRVDPHGYGIDIIHPDFRIDYDYGPAGQIDCFDIWRLALHRHHLTNDVPPVGPYDDIREWVRDSLQCDALTIVANSHDAFFQDPTRLRSPATIHTGG